MRLIILSGLLLLAPLPCRALEPEYLREWPDPQLVITDGDGGLANRRREKTGQFVLFHNWTKTRDVPHPVTWPTLDAIVSTNRWTLYPAIGLGYVIGTRPDSSATSLRAFFAAC